MTVYLWIPESHTSTPFANLKYMQSINHLSLTLDFNVSSYFLYRYIKRRSVAGWCGSINEFFNTGTPGYYKENVIILSPWFVRMASTPFVIAHFMMTLNSSIKRNMLICQDVVLVILVIRALTRTLFKKNRLSEHNFSSWVPANRIEHMRASSKGLSNRNVLCIGPTPKKNIVRGR
jgi:hypothetical protein